MRIPTSMLLSLTVALFVIGCGPTIDRESTLQQLRAAIDEVVTGESVAQAHNDLLIQVREGGVFERMRRHEVQAAIGRGQECGVRELCSRNDFEPDDWVYEVGRTEDGLAAGPTLIVGFDRQGVCTRTYTLTRN